MSEQEPKKPLRLLTEDEAAAVLRSGGSTHVTARTLRWLMQKPGAPARPDFLIDLAAVAAFLRSEAGKAAPGLKGAARLFDEIVPKGARPRALSQAERQARSRARDSHSDIRAKLDAAIAGINWKKRRRAEHDLNYFLAEYCMGEGGFLETPPPPRLREVVSAMQVGVGTASIPTHIRQPRGTGKTAFTKGTCKWVVSTGQRKYAVAVAANSENAGSILGDVFEGMTDNPAFVRDFPEVAIPFIELGGAYQRAKTQTYHGEPTNPKKTEDKIVLPTIRNPKTGLPFPSSGAILEALGINAGARGKSKMTLRPDFLIIDDPQNDDDAESETQVAKIVRKIKRTFMGLAGHRKKIAAIMTTTPIEADDVSEMFAKDKGWRTLTYRLFYSWPTCHDPTKERDPDDTTPPPFDYWEEYADIFQAEKDAGREPHIAANKYYRKHRKAMDAGAEVINPDNFDPETELSAIQHAMNLLFRDGLDAFMSECQMEPTRDVFAFEISSALIMSRVRPGVPANTIPAETVYTAVATDINPAYGLTTAAAAFTVSMTGLVVAYKVFKTKIDGRLNDTAYNAAIHRALTAHAKEIVALGVKFDKWGIDAGGRQFKAVTQFAPLCKGLFGIEAIAMLGRAGQNWNPNVRSRIRRAINDTVLCRDATGRRWLAFNADVYKEKAQRAWGTEVGGDGGLSLFDGGANHAKFAVQIANEKLVEKVKIKNQRGNGEEQYAYKWRTKNPHDFGDCMAMLFALAGAEGLTGEGDAPRRSASCSVGGLKRKSAPAATAPAVSQMETTTPQPLNTRPKCCIGRRR